MLSYTINRLLNQQAILERDQGAEDRYGSEVATDWQPLATVACKTWWEKQSGRGPAREEATTAQTVDIGEGGMLIPGGTDVTGFDRISQVLDANGNVVFDGPFNITAVLAHASYPALIELAFRLPN